MTDRSIPPLSRPHKRPGFALPASAADCHMHVFGPFDRFPLAARRAYDVPDAPLAAHEAMKRDVGLARTVIVQPSGYDTDNRCTLAALAGLGPRGRAVVVVEPDIADGELDVLHRAGARGVRLNLVSVKSRYGDPGALIRTFARRLTPRGWHIQIFASNALIAELETVLAEAPIEIVIDHMGLPDARAGLEQPSFQALLRLLRRGDVWAKLAGADRVSEHTGRPADALPFMRALVAANAYRLSSERRLGRASARPVPAARRPRAPRPARGRCARSGTARENPQPQPGAPLRPRMSAPPAQLARGTAIPASRQHASRAAMCRSRSAGDRNAAWNALRPS